MEISHEKRSVKQFLRKYFCADDPVFKKYSRRPRVQEGIPDDPVFKKLVAKKNSRPKMGRTHGQHTNHGDTEVRVQKNYNETGNDLLASLVTAHRKLISVLFPTTMVYVFYWLLASRYEFYKLFATRYEMTLVMIAGAFIGGATAEGGGVVAFPVMTLLLKVSTITSRDYAAMVQSIGMSCAAVSLLCMRVLMEWHALICIPVPAAIGVIFSLTYLDSLINPSSKKIFFASIFFSFAIALLLLNRQKKRATFMTINPFGKKDLLLLFTVAFLGGCVSGILGTGLEIIVFSLLTLYYRMNEKVVTPTTCVLASINSCFIFFWRSQMQNGIDMLAWEYLATTVPVCVVFAPLGAFFSSHLHRQAIAALTYALESVTLVTAFIVIKPGFYLCLLSLSVILIAFCFYIGMLKLGERRLLSLKPVTTAASSISKETTVNVDK